VVPQERDGLGREIGPAPSFAICLWQKGRKDDSRLGSLNQTKCWEKREGKLAEKGSDWKRKQMGRRKVAEAKRPKRAREA